MSFPRRSPKGLWVVIGLYVAVIYATLPLMRPLLNTAYDILGRDLLGAVVNIVLAVTALALLLWIIMLCRENPRRGAAAMLAVTAGLALAMGYERPEERMHFLQYGLLGFLLTAAMAGGGKPWLSSFAVVAFVGSGDEAIQWFLPNRVGDLRDVLMNCIGGLIGIVAGRAVYRDMH